MNGEEGQYTKQVHCPDCGTSFRVELRKMRFGFPNVCPSCGARCGISQDQAIKAQRLLERLEHLDRSDATLYQPQHVS